MNPTWRRKTWPVKVGNVVIGGESPIRIQSMTSTSTMDTDGSVAQIERITDAGGEIVRLTAQGVREASNLADIKRQVRDHGYDVPLVADIHFNPKAAFEAALHVEKVRINPGNFVDPGRTFKQLEYTDQEYAAEQERIAATLVPFLELCRENGTAVRIGVNHGSLSDRIMSRYGDTPAGMVESAMEFLRIAVRINFKDIVISIKASNTAVMVETVRRLVAAMYAEDMHFPLHLGVTEAGDGDDGRIKSAVGIGTLLADGIGDTIRVSLSEEPECEIPVARALADYVTNHSHIDGQYILPVTPFTNSGAIAFNADGLRDDDCRVYDTTFLNQMSAGISTDGDPRPFIISTGADNKLGDIAKALYNLNFTGPEVPIIARLRYDGLEWADMQLRAAVDAGKLLLDGKVQGIDIENDRYRREQLGRLELDILQATRCRFTKTEFISCPGCGRTLFDLQSTVKRVKEKLSHLKGLKIGIMGCIVNGPGEMADADYGYVGAAAGKVSLYRGKECVQRNIPQEEALDALITLLKEEGKWQEP